MTNLIGRFLERRRVKKERIQKRIEEVRTYPEPYRHAEEFIRDNLIFVEQDVSIEGFCPPRLEINFNDPITIATLKGLSKSDRRSDEEIKNWLKREKEWGKFKLEYLSPSWRNDYIGGVNAHEADRLTKIILAFRITADKTLKQYITEGGTGRILQKTFVDFGGPLRPYQVLDIDLFNNRFGVSMITNDNSNVYSSIKPMEDHLEDRELKTS